MSFLSAMLWISAMSLVSMCEQSSPGNGKKKRGLEGSEKGGRRGVRRRGGSETGETEGWVGWGRGKGRKRGVERKTVKLSRFKGLGGGGNPLPCMFQMVVYG